MVADSKLPDDAFPKVGDVVVDRYKIIRLAGEGGFARVYEARDSKAGGRVALKVLDAEKSLDAHFAKRFQQEVRIVRELRHPHTIKIYDVGVTESGLLYAVMEYAEGDSLHQVIFREGHLPIDRATKITEQILKGLTEAHERGIIHRDLKPSNILLCEVSGQTDYVKILDFGIAKSLVEDLSMVKTQTGMVMGTPGYAAPEVLMGEVATPAADVYAAGLIMVEMLTGRPVVEGDSIAEILLSQIQLQPDAIASDFNMSWFREVVERALAVEPENRYRNTGEMLAALRESREFEAITGDFGSVERPKSAASSELVSEFADTVVSPAIEMPDFPSLIPKRTGDHLAVADDPRDVITEKVTAKQAATEKSDVKKSDAEDTDDAIIVPVGVRSSMWLALAIGLALIALVVFLVTNRSEAPPVQVETQPVVEEPPAPRPEKPPIEVAVVEEPVRDELPVLPGPSAESLSWDWLTDMSGEVDPVELLASRDEEQERDRSARPEAPRRLIADSARLNDQAVLMLESALRDDLIEPERVEDSRTQLADLYDTLLVQLVEAKMCNAAKTRLDHARENVDLLAEGADTRLDAMASMVEECDERAWIAGAEWNPVQFLSLIRTGGAQYEAARSLDPPDPQRRDELLSLGLTDYETARDMLLSALIVEAQPDDRIVEMEESLRWLDARIVAILCTLNKCSAAELHLAQALDQAETEASDPYQSPIFAVEPSITACKARSAMAAAGFDWPVFLQLVELSAEMYARARQLIPPPPTPVNQVRARITSQPSGARIRADGERLGRTPFEGVIESERSRVTLTLSRDGYHNQRVRIDMSDDEVERHVELEQDLPFGRVHRLGEDE